MRQARPAALVALGIWIAFMAAAPAAQPDAPADVASLPALLMATTDRWNAGDLDGFIAPYASDTSFMTPAGLIGRDAVRTRYQTRYFTGSRPDQQLRFDELRVNPLGAGHALMTGRFVLSGGGTPEQSGRFTLVWARTAEGWRIIHDHSS
jgi:ketosteroid isomerase-like protein